MVDVFPKSLVVILLDRFEHFVRQQAVLCHPAKLTVDLLRHEERSTHAFPRDVELLDFLRRSLERNHDVPLVNPVAEELERFRC